MGKKPEDIKKQKEKELAKKRKALEKRRREANKNDPQYVKKLQGEKQNKFDKNLSFLTEKIVSNKFCLPVLTVICFFIMSAVCYIKGYKIFASDFDVIMPFQCLYAGDFSIGFCSRLFIGSVLSLFTDFVTTETINIFARTAFYLSFVLQSFIAAAVIKKGIGNRNWLILLFAAVFLVDPVTVCQYAFYHGLLDLYNYIVFLVCVLILTRKSSYLQFAVPILSFIGLAIHYQYFMAFFPAVFVLGLYRTVNCEKTALGKEAAAFGINTVISCAFFFYFVVLAEKTLTMTSDEMLNYVSSKTDAFIFEDYLVYYLYGSHKGIEYSTLGDFLGYLVQYTFKLTRPSVYIKYLSFTAPLFISFWSIWGVLIKREKGLCKLPFIFASIMPFALVIELLISSDVWRWVSAAVVSQFTVLFALYIMKAPCVNTLLNNIKNMKKSVKITVLFLFAAYMAFCFAFVLTDYK